MASVQKLASLRVGVVNVAAPYRGKAFVYRQDELKFEADFYSEFFVAPAAMLSEATARALAAANVFRARRSRPARADAGDYVLDGFVVRALRRRARCRRSPPRRSRSRSTCRRRTRSTPSVIWSREYRQRVPVAEATPDALARAWNAALSAILADLARDLAAAELPK